MGEDAPQFKLPDLIKVLGKAPETQLDAQGSGLCVDWDGEDPVRFLRDLLDLSVRYAWASSLLITTMQVFLSDAPKETEEEADARREALLAIWEPK